VISWRFAGGVGGPFRLRVLHVPSDGIEAGAGTSSPVIPPGPGPTAPLPTKLPIAAGETIGIDNSSFGDKLGTKVPTTSATFYAWYPPLIDGAPSRGGQPGAGELGFNATVRYCVVPRLVGKKLGRAKRSLRAADCALGRITPKREAKRARGRARFVESQGVAAGRRISDTAGVNLRVATKGEART